MARQLHGLSDDELWERWGDDIERIKLHAYELLKVRRVFCEIAEGFRWNERLQATGGHLWNLILVTYASFVAMRIRRETDDQGNTFGMTRLLMDMTQRPAALTRERYMRILALPPDSALIEVNHRYFTDVWTAGRAADSVIDIQTIERDRIALDRATARVEAVSGRVLAYRQRVFGAELGVTEVDGAFKALEEIIPKYYTLLRGGSPAMFTNVDPRPKVRPLTFKTLRFEVALRETGASDELGTHFPRAPGPGVRDNTE